ncbi:hypothetical protein [Mycolicibacterium goodii]|uniref:Uncharacterized protein n=1 Tax=Mycolicibacterium goodii TaxID=134601 RepID=A0ABS6HW51_MYCGD|nr:hypothetical protein [Mycolicibacterium goodii]MBU8825622.1 hypothetical protein [Mycolicibacterium goodii]
MNLAYSSDIVTELVRIPAPVTAAGIAARLPDSQTSQHRSPNKLFNHSIRKCASPMSPTTSPR